MTLIIPTHQNTQQARSMHRDVIVENDFYYFFLGRTAPWTNELTPPTPVDTREFHSSVMQNLEAVKRVQPTDVCFLAPRHDWTTGTVYDRYDDTVDLTDAIFFVITDTFRVYKCLNNAGGVVSTSKPTHTTLPPVETADGYVWQYMYTVTESDQLKFLTDEYIPVRFYSTTTRFNYNGIIDSINVNRIGSGYTEAPLVAINGDGQGATAVATISSGSVLSIEVLSEGFGYTYATVELISTSGSGAEAEAVLGRTDAAENNSLVAGYAETVDGGIVVVDVVDGGENYVSGNTFASVVGDGTGAEITLTIVGGVITKAEMTDVGEGYTYATVVVTTTSGSGAVLRPIIGPQGGHGSNVPEEFMASTLGVFLDLEPDEADFGAIEEFRQYGIIKNVRNAENVLIQDNTATKTDINTKSGTIVCANNIVAVERDPLQSETFRFYLHF